MIRYLSTPRLQGGTCHGCGKRSLLVAADLGSCLDCIRQHSERVLPRLKAVHAEARRQFGLPVEPPQAADGVLCTFCINECRIAEGEMGYCGLRRNRGGKLLHLGGTAARGVLEWYYDPLPTNCVAEWVCAERESRGFKNLAVFYGACSFDCLFCQNWHYRVLAHRLAPAMSAQELADCVDESTACICYFGGDPSPQMPHAIATARLALRKRRARPLRICWETNGSMSPALLRQAAALAMDSGGTIKFDLKAWDENLHLALCGLSNKRTLENFAWLGELFRQRREPPLLTASTLLVPGYIDAHEVGQIARFIASLDPAIPYSLLAFYPHFFMANLPTTSRRHAGECWQVAKEAGLANVKVGNLHLLSDLY
ncbi:MAG: radical SAM protein [Dehalococcoidia bacterium]